MRLVSNTVGGINLFQTLFSASRVRLSLLLIAVIVAAGILFVVVPVLLTGVLGICGDIFVGFDIFNAFGDPILYQHIFWFFGHPEVYVLALPAFGIVSELISVFGFVRIFGFNSMVVAVVVVGFVGFFVWGHHMFVTGLGVDDRLMYMCASVAISIPTSLKLVNWVLCLNLLRNMRVVTLVVGSFVGLFIIGGITGLVLANSAVNVLLHDSFLLLRTFIIFYRLL